MLMKTSKSFQMLYLKCRWINFWKFTIFISAGSGYFFNENRTICFMWSAFPIMTLSYPNGLILHHIFERARGTTCFQQTEWVLSYSPNFFQLCENNPEVWLDRFIISSAVSHSDAWHCQAEWELGSSRIMQNESGWSQLIKPGLSKSLCHLSGCSHTPCPLHHPHHLHCLQALGLPPTMQ